VSRSLGWVVSQPGAAAGGLQPWVNSRSQAVSQGQAVGRCRVIRRAEEARRAGTVMSLRRMVAVVALARSGPVRVAAARVRLSAITASTSQAALAANLPSVTLSPRPGGPADLQVCVVDTVLNAATA
jgi:hypothetical protein